VNLHDAKKTLQAHFTDGLVTIIGSGLSAASGLPTMWGLAQHLMADVPARCDDASAAEWETVAERLRRDGDLEAALGAVNPHSPLVPIIVDATARLIIQCEKVVFQDVLRGRASLSLSRLLPHLIFAETTAHVVTTNYDRLIEFVVELAKVSLDTGFPGANYGSLDPARSREALTYYIKQTRPVGMKRMTRPYVALYKPHGSVDWFLHNQEPVRCPYELDAPRLMITPGTSKYRLGYDSPFDYHRTAANRAIDTASRFLIIGYGFNDDQLETHLRPKLRSGSPGILLTKALTPNASALVADCPSLIALVDSGDDATDCLYSGERTRFDGVRLWNLENFVSEVLE
jgi:hypothetical protein